LIEQIVQTISQAWIGEPSLRNSKFQRFSRHPQPLLAALVWFYNQRAGAENLIKESNNDAGLAAYPSRRWMMNANWFQIVILAYNLNCWLHLFNREEGSLRHFNSRVAAAKQPPTREAQHIRREEHARSVHNSGTNASAGAGRSPWPPRPSTYGRKMIRMPATDTRGLSRLCKMAARCGADDQNSINNGPFINHNYMELTG
jgi:hypothetical protein